jgi:hypothetical protein
MATRFQRQTACTLVLVSNSMKGRRTIFIKVVASLLVASACGQETTTPLGPEWATWAMITRFHHVFDKRNQLEMRLLEADGTATVGLNPVSLYVVITNNSSAADLQQYVWLLPHAFGMSKASGSLIQFYKLRPKLMLTLRRQRAHQEN